MFLLFKFSNFNIFKGFLTSSKTIYKKSILKNEKVFCLFIIKNLTSDTTIFKTVYLSSKNITDERNQIPLSEPWRLKKSRGKRSSVEQAGKKCVFIFECFFYLFQHYGISIHFELTREGNNCIFSRKSIQKHWKQCERKKKLENPQILILVWNKFITLLHSTVIILSTFIWAKK